MMQRQSEIQNGEVEKLIETRLAHPDRIDSHMLICIEKVNTTCIFHLPYYLSCLFLDQVPQFLLAMGNGTLFHGKKRLKALRIRYRLIMFLVKGTDGILKFLLTHQITTNRDTGAG